MNFEESSIILTADGCSVAPGTPEFYAPAVIFLRLQEDSKFARNIYEAIGSRDVCIGNLGRCGSDGTYYEPHHDFSLEKSEKSVKGMGYYEKIER